MAQASASGDTDNVRDDRGQRTAIDGRERHTELGLLFLSVIEPKGVILTVEDDIQSWVFTSLVALDVRVSASAGVG